MYIVIHILCEHTPLGVGINCNGGFGHNYWQSESTTAELEDIVMSCKCIRYHFSWTNSRFRWIHFSSYLFAISRS